MGLLQPIKRSNKNQWWNNGLKDCSVNDQVWANSIHTVEYLAKYKEVIADDIFSCLLSIRVMDSDEASPVGWSGPLKEATQWASSAIAHVLMWVHKAENKVVILDTTL